MKHFQQIESGNQVSASSILRAFALIAIIFTLSFQSVKAQITVPCVDFKGAHVTNISIAPNPSDTELHLTADNNFDMTNVHFTSVTTATEVWNASVQGSSVFLNVSELAEDHYSLFIEGQGGIGCKIDEIIVVSHN